MNSSDVTLTVIIVIIFIFLYIFNVLVVNIQRIKNNWPEERCKPLVMPFAGIFGHDAKENFAFCIQNLQKGFMGHLLKPLNFNIDVLGDVAGGLTKNIEDVREFLDFFRFSIMDTFVNIFTVLFNVIIEVQRLFINVKDMIGKIVGIMASLMYMLQGSIMTMESAWNGPPGGLVRALCFHPETKIKLKNGDIVNMKDIKLNSILSNNAQVYAVMQISNLDKNGNHIETIYKVKPANKENHNDTILVSGSHLVYDNSMKEFVHAKDLPQSEVSETNYDVLSCLITSDHTIPIDGLIFHDWEDNNGSESKSRENV